MTGILGAFATFSILGLGRHNCSVTKLEEIDFIVARSHLSDHRFGPLGIKSRSVAAAMTVAATVAAVGGDHAHSQTGQACIRSAWFGHEIDEPHPFLGWKGSPRIGTTRHLGRLLLLPPPLHLGRYGVRVHYFIVDID